MFLIKIALVALILLLIGDFISTFFYHVPEHVFGKFHFIVHHVKNRSFIHYAVLTKNPLLLLDGIAGALPYFLFVPWLWQISPMGTIVGLILGEFHVIWRHISILNWHTLKLVQYLCKVFFITTPERHWLHHQNVNLAFGDIFTFYDIPARKWQVWLIYLRKKYRKLGKIAEI